MEISKEVIIRVFEEKDTKEVEEVENQCEVGHGDKLSISTSLLGDPLCRIRNSPAFLMLVAEVVDDNSDNKKCSIVGMIRGSIKFVTCDERYRSSSEWNSHLAGSSKNLPTYSKVGYILGLRVAPSHRRMGIASKLVSKLEEWFKQSGAEYSYMVTASDNYGSTSLFTHKFGYSKFRTSSILVQPVFAHKIDTPHHFSIIKLNPSQAEIFYRNKFSSTEFFPHDIDVVINNNLNLGTFLAVLRESESDASSTSEAKQSLFSKLDGENQIMPESWAILSIWNCSSIMKFQVHGASCMSRWAAKLTRLIDQSFPFLNIPSFPDLFSPFGLHFLYGIGGEGPQAVNMVEALCGFAHNLAQDYKCAVLVAEVSNEDPLKLGIPRWKKLSCEEDWWCIKRLRELCDDEHVDDWTKSRTEGRIFIDPREF